MVDEYIFSGTLPENAPSYVKRSADDELYEGLKAGKFCYVLNSRQTGKSSLRVQVMRRLKLEGVACTAIDISMDDIQHVTPNQWYANMLRSLTIDFELDVNLGGWWRDREWLSPLRRLREFIETVLLVQISQNIVIFFDEIDSILSLNFPTDDFFAFIRACYNQRVDNSAYDRLTFCLLGVATPSDLIQDKQRTPFNIGCAIELTGFKIEEAKKSLISGLSNKFDEPEQILTEILDWTGGHPFLTQKLCRLVVEKAENKRPIVTDLVQNYIIENWEASDEPEHLKTIRDRILRNEKRAGRLLGLYQHILSRGEIAADSSPEQMELRLSVLVVNQQAKLKIYNRIYEAVFNQQWVDKALANLRPYSQAITAWLASNCQDTSRLLRGQALQEALNWKVGKSLSVEDDDFLATSQRVAWEQIHQDLEAERQAKKILTEAKQKAEQLLEEAKEGTQIERAGVKALRLFEVEGKEIESLLLAMQTGLALKTIVKNCLDISRYPATSPLLALQVILERIREKNQFSGHQGAVNSVCFSPSGESIATASEDGTARLWDLTGQSIVEFIGHQGKVRCVRFSPTEEFIVTTSEDGTARLWNLAGNQITEFIGHTAWVGSASFSPQGDLIVTASEDKTARLWDLEGNQLAELQGHKGRVLSACFSPKGNLIATSSEDGNIKLWDLEGKEIAQLKGHKNWVMCVSFNPKGDRLATASADGTAKLWDLQGNQLAQFWGHQAWVWNICFNAEGDLIATASADGTARLWDLDGKQLDQFRGHQGTVVCVNFSPNGKFLATALSDGTARLWNIQGNLLATLKGHKAIVLSVNFSPDGKLLATSSFDGTPRVWDLSGKELVRLKGHQGWVNSAAFSPKGNLIVTTAEDNTARLWDVNGQEIAQLKGHSNWVLGACFSPDGERVATGSADGTAFLWDLKGNKIGELKGHKGKVVRIKFSPKGKYIATASDDRVMRVWDLEGNEIAVFKGHQGLVWELCFHPDGDRLVTASDDGTARLWDLQGNGLVEFKGHHGAVLGVSVSPIGNLIATASTDGTARLWDLQGNQVALFQGHQDPVWAVSFSPDGKLIATASADCTARLWKVGRLGRDLDELLSRGCDWLKDYLDSHPEVKKTFGDCQ